MSKAAQRAQYEQNRIQPVAAREPAPRPQYTVTKKARNILRAAKAAKKNPAAPIDGGELPPDPNNQYDQGPIDDSGGSGFDVSGYLAALEAQMGVARGNINQANSDLLAKYSSLQKDYYGKADATNAQTNNAYAAAGQQAQAASASLGNDVAAQGFSTNPLQQQLQTQLAALEAQHANQTGLASNLRNVYAQQAADRTAGAELMHTGALNDLEGAGLAAASAATSGGGGGRGGGGGGGGGKDYSALSPSNLNYWQDLYGAVNPQQPDPLGAVLSSWSGSKNGNVRQAVKALKGGAGAGALLSSTPKSRKKVTKLLTQALSAQQKAATAKRQPTLADLYGIGQALR